MTAPALPPTGRQPRSVDGEGKVTLTLRVNGQAHVVRTRPHHSILDVLREEVGLTGPREVAGSACAARAPSCSMGAPYPAASCWRPSPRATRS